MGYIHSIGAVMMANDVARRRKEVLSKLQKEFYDLVLAGVQDDPATMAALETEEEWEAYCRALEADVKTMNAAELRHNIKVWKDTE